MAYSDSNFFDKLLDTFGNFMTMEQIAKFALTSKVILSYKIDFLNSFHDLLMKGLWKRSSNGCIYPLDKGCERILYVEINEDYEVNLEKSLENLRNLSARKVFDKRPEPDSCVAPAVELVSKALEVFDEMLEPNSCLNQVHIVETNTMSAQTSRDTNFNPPSHLHADIGLRTSFDDGESHADLHEFLEQETQSKQVSDVPISNAHKMFAEMSNPVVISSELLMSTNEDKCAYNYENGENIFCVDVSEPQIDCHNTESDQELDVQKVLDELPLPTFIREMAEAAKITDLDSAQDDSDTIYEDSNDSLAYKQVFAKLGTLDGPYFWDMVVIGASVGRFSILQRSSYLLDQMSQHCNGIYGENLYFRCPSPQVSMNLIKTDIRPLLCSDIDWFMGSNFSSILGVEGCDTRMFGLEHGYRMTLSFKLDIDKMAIVCSRTTWAHASYGVCCIFADDLGDHTCIATSRVMDQYKFFDPGIKMVLCDNFTFEDKGDFKGDGVYDISTHSFIATNDNLICQKKYMEIMRFTVKLGDVLYHMPTLKQCHIWLEKGHLLCNAFLYCQLKRDEIIHVFIWDPGSVIMIVLGMLKKSNKNVKSTKCWVASSRKFNARAHGCLLAIAEEIECSSQLLVLLDNAIERAAKFTFYQRRLSNYIKLVLITLDSWRIIWSSDSGRKDFSVISGIFMIEQISHFVYDPGGLQCNHSHVEAKVRFLQEAADLSPKPHAPEQMKSLRRFLSSKSVNSVTVRVFDPGGYGSELERTKRSQPYNYGGKQRVKDNHQSYVFDPGGLLTRLINAMQSKSNSQPEMYRHVLFKYRLSYILEDKDHFKRRVLIHTHYIGRGILVISASI